MRAIDSDAEKVIECDQCSKCLNGLSLWVVKREGELEPFTLCEQCYSLEILEGK